MVIDKSTEYKMDKKDNKEKFCPISKCLKCQNKEFIQCPTCWVKPLCLVNKQAVWRISLKKHMRKPKWGLRLGILHCWCKVHRDQVATHLQWVGKLSDGEFAPLFLSTYDFGPSKLFWMDPNCFGWVQIVLVGSKPFSLGSNQIFLNGFL